MPEIKTICSEERFQDLHGNWWTIGEVTPDGFIVGRPCGGIWRLVDNGIVWVKKEKLEKAMAHGWRQNGGAVSGMVQVERGCPECLH